MRCLLGLAPVLLFALLAQRIWEVSTCARNQYPLGSGKCCKKCPPGEELTKRCMRSTETVCEDCAVGYYNEDYTESRCKPCTICHQGRGLQEVAQCKKTSDTVCTCLPGHSPARAQFSEKICKRCPNGHFSKGGDQECQPWRNCTAEGRKVLIPGGREEDVICSEQPSMPPRLATVPFRSNTEREHDILMTKPASTHTLWATRLKEPDPSVTRGPETENRSFVLIISISAVLLLIMGGLVHQLLFRKKKKEKERRPKVLSQMPQEDGRSSYRIPIQEEQVDCKSTLVRN